MPTRSPAEHPRAVVAAASATHGSAAVIAWAAGLLDGSIAYDDPAYPRLTELAGRAAEWVLAHEDIVDAHVDYWPRVWGARVLLYAWSPMAAPAVAGGLGDSAWRVREMCAKVVRARELGETADRLVVLVDDPVPRVRVAAIRALARVAEREHLGAVLRACDDPERSVRAAAARALDDVAARLDRSIEDLRDDLLDDVGDDPR